MVTITVLHRVLVKDGSKEGEVRVVVAGDGKDFSFDMTIEAAKGLSALLKKSVTNCEADLELDSVELKSGQN